MLRTIKYIVKEAMLLCLIMLQITVFFIVWHHYEVNTYFRNIDKAWAIIAAYMIVHLLMMKLFGVTEVGHGRLIDILFGEFMSVCFTNLLTYLQLCMLQDYPYMYSIKVIGLIIIINSVLSILMLSFIHFIYKVMTPAKGAVLIIYEGDDLGKIMERKRRNDKSINIESVILLKKEEDIDINTIIDDISNFDIIILGDLKPLLRNNILKYCYESDKKCYTTAKASDVLIKSTKTTQLGYRLVYMHNTKQMLLWQKFWKRVMDIIISIIGLIITFPIMAIVPIAIKITDKGSVFFTQDRYTINGKIFKIYKFRSMYQDAEDKISITKLNDDRITPVGKIIRRTHIDEIPQFINVLKGDMSIVGPRPQSKELHDSYILKYPEYRYRLKVKAGLTGYAQVYGKYSIRPEDKLKFDLFYICNYSLLLDLKLLILTFKVFLAKDTSEGVEVNE